MTKILEVRLQLSELATHYAMLSGMLAGQIYLAETKEAKMELLGEAKAYMKVSERLLELAQGLGA